MLMRWWRRATLRICECSRNVSRRFENWRTLALGFWALRCVVLQSIDLLASLHGAWCCWTRSLWAREPHVRGLIFWLYVGQPRAYGQSIDNRGWQHDFQR